MELTAHNELLTGDTEDRNEIEGQGDSETPTPPQKCLRCTKCCHQCRVWCKPLLTKYNPVTADATQLQRFRYLWLCPPHGKVARCISIIAIYALFFGVLVTVLSADFDAPFAWECMVLLIVGVVCTIAGQMVQCVRLPPLLGMLIAGCMLRNIPVVKEHVGEQLNTHWSAALRNMALGVILVRAGLGLDPAALRKLSCVVVRLAFTPCLVETATVTVMSLLLLGFPWQFGLMLGFVLGAVTPAVVVPTVLSLQSRGYGVDQGIPTLVIAASSVDDVLAITGFGVTLGITFSTGNLVWTLFKGPLEAIVGVVVGVVWGVFLWYIPPQDSKHIVAYRGLILIGGALFAIFGSLLVDFPGSGPLAALSMAFVAAYRWRCQGWTDDNSPMNTVMEYLWVILEPLLFGLIGAEVDLDILEPEVAGLGIAVLSIGLITRLLATFLVVSRADLTHKEKLFVAIAWLPKATVQYTVCGSTYPMKWLNVTHGGAAIGSVALDMARRQFPNDKQVQLLGTGILMLAVMSIVITAPLGAVAIMVSGPFLLRKSSSQNQQNTRQNTDENTQKNGGMNSDQNSPHNVQNSNEIIDEHSEQNCDQGS